MSEISFYKVSQTQSQVAAQFYNVLKVHGNLHRCPSLQISNKGLERWKPRLIFISSLYGSPIDMLVNHRMRQHGGVLDGMHGRCTKVSGGSRGPCLRVDRGIQGASGYDGRPPLIDGGGMIIEEHGEGGM